MSVSALKISDSVSEKVRMSASEIGICLWTFISIGRPQDILPILGRMRIGVIIACITILLYLLQSNKSGRINPFATRDGRLVTALMVLMCVSGALGVYPRLSLEFLEDFWKVFVYYLILRSLTTSIRAVSNLVFVLICGTGMLGAMTIAAHGVGSARLSVGGMYDPNDLGMLIVTTIPLGLYYLLLQKGFRKWITMASIVSSLIALGLTQSRGAFLGLCFVGLCFLINKTGFKSRFRKLLSFVVVAGILVAFMPKAYLTRLSHSLDANDTGMGRLKMWEEGLSLVPEAPLLGHGVDTYSFTHGMELSQGRFDVDPHSWGPYAWRAAHSAYVTVIVELGIVGLGIYLALCGISILGLARRNYVAVIVELGIVGLGIFLELFGISIMGLRRRNSKKRVPAHASEENLRIYATMIQISFLGFMVCAAFLSAAYYSIFFFLVSVSGSLLDFIESNGTTSDKATPD